MPWLKDVPHSFDPVYGTSLNDLFKNAYVHYLHNDGHATRNVASFFYWDSNLNKRIVSKKDEVKRRHMTREKALAAKEKLMHL
jgi:hypothetical protein